MKRCSKCKHLKSPDKFSFSSWSKDGLHNQCKSCVNAKTLDEKNPLKHVQADKLRDELKLKRELAEVWE